MPAGPINADISAKSSFESQTAISSGLTVGNISFGPPEIPKTFAEYTPWIVGGVIALVLGIIFLRK